MGRSNRSGAKSIALFGAVLILAAQFLALTHFHQGNPTRQLNAQTQVVADDGLCALCILAFHAPLNPAATPALERSAPRNSTFLCRAGAAPQCRFARLISDPRTASRCRLTVPH